MVYDARHMSFAKLVSDDLRFDTLASSFSELKTQLFSATGHLPEGVV